MSKPKMWPPCVEGGGAVLKLLKCWALARVAAGALPCHRRPGRRASHGVHGAKVSNTG